MNFDDIKPSMRIKLGAITGTISHKPPPRDGFFATMDEPVKMRYQGTKDSREIFIAPDDAQWFERL